MTAIQQKIKRKFGSTTDYSDNALFVHADGTITSGGHRTHDEACKLSGVTLTAYIGTGGVRVKVFREHIAVESMYSLTPKQIDGIGLILRAGAFFYLFTCIAGVHNEVQKFDRRITIGNLLKLVG